ncbi:MAG TPA: EAL domain-containing protein, partial [Bacilli bacterium]|nr:EAL domain-containing protein [Bacilli bacterium]
GKDADTLLQNADLAGYEAKHSNSKVVFCSDQLKNRIRENTLLTNKLFNAMQNKEFSLEFQPQINSKTEKTAGVEALLRWNYEDKKRIPPDIFIPILEQTGLIHDVGLWVLEQALQEHNRLVAKGFPPLRFSVNLSIIQFREDNFVPEIIKIIKESKVNPKYIELEITESFLSINFADTIAKLSKLKEFGVSIAIDDFGKGYSSLQRLDLVPFDRIKIDKSIVDDITLKTKKIVIVKTIVSLAKSLMAGITAEGVETKEQLDFLKNIDRDEIQGYYYSKPLPIEVLEEFLKKENA